jgi:hypothetical protein
MDLKPQITDTLPITRVLEIACLTNCSRLSTIAWEFFMDMNRENGTTSAKTLAFVEGLHKVQWIAETYYLIMTQGSSNWSALTSGFTDVQKRNLWTGMARCAEAFDTACNAWNYHSCGFADPMDHRCRYKFSNKVALECTQKQIPTCDILARLKVAQVIQGNGRCHQKAIQTSNIQIVQIKTDLVRCFLEFDDRFAYAFMARTDSRTTSGSSNAGSTDSRTTSGSSSAGSTSPHGIVLNDHNIHLTASSLINDTDTPSD